jgi:hypothetical protein
VHHRAVHEGGFGVEIGPTGTANFYDPRGRALPDRPPMARDLRQPVETLLQQNGSNGVEPDWRTSSARWRREEDIPQAVYRWVLQGLDGAGG